ncbi:MAG: response regulator transcription factor [Rhizomicrobium sp.]|jgi:two-component system KDP operon response regulator KdpE
MALDQAILLIDDDIQIRRFLKVGLAAGGFKVSEARTGAAGLERLGDEEFALIILDIGLPDMNGIEVLREIRKASQIPVIVLSVRNDEAGKVQAFELGADDYVTKPFGMAEFLARIRTAIRHRLQSAGIHPLLRVGTLEIDLTSHHVRRNNVEIQLTRTEFSLLRLFVEHPNKVLTHEFILRAIRGRYDPRDSQYLRVYMRALRSKIEDPTAGKKIIETVTGVGYRLANEQAAGSAAS